MRGLTASLQHERDTRTLGTPTWVSRVIGDCQTLINLAGNTALDPDTLLAWGVRVGLISPEEYHRGDMHLALTGQLVADLGFA